MMPFIFFLQSHANLMSFLGFLEERNQNMLLKKKILLRISINQFQKPSIF
jgi:hypothetical protein